MGQQLPAAVIIGVVGAGAMGAGIAQVAAQAGHRVLLTDAHAGAVERAQAGIVRDLGHMVSRGRMTSVQAESVAARIEAAPLASFGGCGLVVEAIVEDLETKRGRPVVHRPPRKRAADDTPLNHDALPRNRIMISSPYLSMIFSENRFALFRIML